MSRGGRSNVEDVWVWWSSGKDSAWALHEIREAGRRRVSAIVTTVTDPFDRVSMHGVRNEILRAQAHELKLPLYEVRIPHPCTNAEYEEAVRPVIRAAREAGAVGMAFGDLHLEDVREYRENLLKGSGLEPLFPLWRRPTGRLARAMLDGGLEARITCIDPDRLPRDFAGRRFDAALLGDLPDDVDPCGENGEFHTCVTAGPFFAAPLLVSAGGVVEREGFVFADLELTDPADPARP